jgi:glycosyltransferase involved in cell wall biosynthesis
VLKEHHAIAVFCRTSRWRRPEFELSFAEQEGVSVWRVNHTFLETADYEGYYLQPQIDDRFRHVLNEWQPDLVHFQHCLGLSARLPEIAHARGVPSVLTLHDYWYICPTVQLLTARGGLCPGTHHLPNCFECVGFANPAVARLHRTWLYRQARLRAPESLRQAVVSALRPLLESAPSPAGQSTTAPAPPSAPEQQHAIAVRVATMRRALALPQRLTAPSAFVKDVYVEFGVARDRIEVLPLGMDLAQWPNPVVRRASSPAGLRFAYLGGLLPHKGVEVMVRAFQQVKGAAHELHLHGFDSADARFNQELDTLIQADARIRKHGPYPHADTLHLLRGVDVLLVPSLWHETFSFVAREAVLAGVWVLASDVGALREVVVPGRTGQRLPPGDVTAWAAALQGTIATWPPTESPAEPSFPVWTQADYAARLEALYQSVLIQN